MAALNKLAIRGIRSFDDKQIAIIEFFSPVTVIVGHNVLKYATTGDQPPNTRGGAFIHDPKMANEKEVKAQVRLRFRASNGKLMLATRNLSVTVKKTGLTMKTLESILGLANTNAEQGGKRGVISTKCAEMDTEIPQLLGVSKAILENVIFCHQEDSYWPLAEPSALKKKFDEIFEATRYTKALDSIKGLRKDRTAELKAEKERLLSLQREKQHSDKLKGRVTELNSTIASKEVEYEETKTQYQAVAEANLKFQEHATSLEEKKSRLQSDLAEAKLNLQEIPGQMKNLHRASTLDVHISSQKQKRWGEDAKRQDLDDALLVTRSRHTELIAWHGRLLAEAEAHKQQMAERESMIREIGEKHGIKGYNISPLDRNKVIEFMSRLGDVQRKQRTELENLQNELRAKTEEYNRKARQLDSEIEGHRHQKKNFREQITERHISIKNAERRLEEQQGLPAEQLTLQSDIEEKKARMEKIRADVASMNYDSKLSEKSERSRSLEEKREGLNNEMRILNLQADSRAKLELKREEMKSKSIEIQNTLDIANSKFRKLSGKDLTVDVEREQADAETEVAAINNDLQKAETTLSNFKKQVEAKTNEMKLLTRKLKTEIEHDTLDEAIKEATTELNHRKSVAGSLVGTSSVYESLLKAGKQRKVCAACNRHLDDHELIVFEKYLNDQMKKASPDTIANNNRELKEWEEELERLQNLRPVRVARDQIKLKELPALEKQVKEEESSYPKISQEAEEAIDKVDAIKHQLKDILTLKQHASTITRLQKEIERAKQDINSLGDDLSATGSMKTAEDLQIELEKIGEEIRANDRERHSMNLEKERQQAAIRTLETSLHQMELRERDLANELREKSSLEQRIRDLRSDIDSFTNQLKTIESQLAAAQAPIDALEEDNRQVQSELNSKISLFQQTLQDLNMSIDKLNNINKVVERYVKDNRGREIEACASKIEDHDNEIRSLGDQIENCREVIGRIDKEINESGASIANLRENIRVRKLAKDITDTVAEIGTHDMEEAARARRNFQEKFQPAKEKESRLQTADEFSHLGGELSSLKSQLKSLETDLKEFKDINKKYTDQLVRVKVSDMANNDLEKYAKALDNAIMKYHSLKMEEVNDTMKHLWNKTYQGTDIDGIKIRSDVEGGASKRSYNYRVVMTKDQVEMDMRGRCSAGQKMLASIIIRLALSDSFGQNCGILALDEPTNALDTENVDALASSLVDIINERKTHSNFQLIIITHDENFLRKLGQSDVMEYYWRVSRDSRQKSIIDRHGSENSC
ncbi:hypothetical protein BDQ17DRAFT_1386857 [Cyathus striatus]|nr:hypothetical protein BDQ17DRAFT_1386857 [Cyathus striatus]